MYGDGMINKKQVSQQDKNGNSNSTYCIRTISRGRKDFTERFLDHFTVLALDVILINETDLRDFINLYEIFIVAQLRCFK